MAITFNVAPLQEKVPIVAVARTPTIAFQRDWQALIAAVKGGFVDVSGILDQLADQQIQITEAVDLLADAISDIADTQAKIVAILNGSQTFTGLKVDGKRVDNFVAYLNNAGEQIIDGNAFPYNVPSGSARSYSSFPLTSTDSAISIAAVGYAIPNDSGTLAAGSVSGLSADTPYRVFYNPNLSLYTAQPPPASAYLSSPDGWQFIGDVKTTTGGIYGPPDPLPPGFDPGFFSGGMNF